MWWFNNLAQAQQPRRGEWSGKAQAQLKEQLLALHKHDPAPIADIIRAVHAVEVYPVYDIPSLPRWHHQRVCLIGDAAHATAPHIGQGAALALEDTVVLARCLRDAPVPADAFARFQALRQGRVEAIIEQARKVGDQKTVPNAVQRFLRDLLLSMFVKREAKKTHRVYAYCPQLVPNSVPSDALR